MAPARGTRINGAAVRAIREAKGWKLSKFAVAALVSTGYLSNIESERKTRVSPEVLHRIAKVLDVPPAAISSPYYDVSEHTDTDDSNGGTGNGGFGAA